MKSTIRPVISVEDETEKLNIIANRHGLKYPLYIEKESIFMGEFDGMKWKCLL